ncbi:hypothetical protein HanRHA438_Chr01g0009531 [Helianthus annuus]|nr:hypothetical protein HanRHA438_Chr01g0009531 [Helianthus annuus]
MLNIRIGFENFQIQLSRFEFGFQKFEFEFRIQTIYEFMIFTSIRIHITHTHTHTSRFKRMEKSFEAFSLRRTRLEAKGRSSINK